MWEVKTNFEASLYPTKRGSFSSIYPWIVWGLGAAFFLSEYFARIAPGIMVPELMSTFKVNAMSLGSLSAIFYIAYLGMQMPVGSLIDRFGPHLLLTVTALICGLGCFVFAGAETLMSAKVGRFLMGFGAAFAFVGTLKLASTWFSFSRFGFLSGLTQSLGMVGAATAAGPLAWVSNGLGWRSTMWLIGVVLILEALLIGLMVRNRPQNISLTTIKQLTDKTGFWQSFIVVFRNPQSWLNSLVIGLTYAPTAGFAELWGTSYITQVYNIDRTLAANAVSCIFLGLAIGCPISGWISDKIKLRRPVLICAVLGSLLFMSLALYLPSISFPALLILLFLYGLSNSGFAVSYAIAGEINSRSVVGTSLGFANLASVVIGAMFQPIIGYFLDLQWNGTWLNGAPFYSSASYRQAMIALPLCLIIALVAAIFLKETYCKGKN